MDCRLCSPELSPLLGESRSWRWVLNRNQDLLGKSMLVSRRHIDRVDDVDENAWEGLHRFLRRVARRTREVLRPARLNLAFLGNEDRHVHLHLIPRYAEPVELAGIAFDDPGFPGHYVVGHDRRVDDEVRAAIVARLRLPPVDPDATFYDHFLPPRRMRPTALCVLSRDGEILVGEGYDPVSGTTFLRPPGGEIEFGELAGDAVVREVREELGIDLVDVRRLGVLEEIYTHRGATGHEVAFVFDGRSADATVYDRDELTVREELGASTRAVWASPRALRGDDRTVVPPGLLDLFEADASDRG